MTESTDGAILANVDVVVIGSGTAGLCAALAARAEGATVVVIDAAPIESRGGDSAFATGTMRTPYSGVDDIRALIPGLTDAETQEIDFGEYTREAYFDDLVRMTNWRTDPDLADVLARESFDTLVWMVSQGVRFLPMFKRQTFKVNGRYKFWGDVVIEASGGGVGIIDALTKTAERGGVRFLYGTPAASLFSERDSVRGVNVVTPEGEACAILARATVIATGGFAANSEWRARYLGPGWDLARVRGSRYSRGDGLRMALEAGANSAGHWSGCHAVAWDSNAPTFCELGIGTEFARHSYPLGIMVNVRGRRFVDEGADFRNYTYGVYGKAIMEQPQQIAWQVFDAKVIPLLREEYRGRRASRSTASSLPELAKRMQGIDGEEFLRTVEEFNRAVRTDVPFVPAVKDGRGTQGLTVPKTNWANPIDTPPFEAYEVTAGLSFTYGGLRADENGSVLDFLDRPIPGLFAAGGVVGGLFYHNSPSGISLTAAAVFGRRAGRHAATQARHTEGQRSEVASI